MFCLGGSVLWPFSAEHIALHVRASEWVCSLQDMVEACSVLVSEAPSFDVAGARVDYSQD